MYTMLPIILAGLVLNQIIFFLGLGYIIIGLIQYVKHQNGVSKLLLVVCIMLFVERIWLFETAIFFSSGYSPSLERTINLAVYLVIMTVLNIFSLIMTWYLYHAE